MAVVKAPESIITYGLGSCVGLVLYDKVNKLAGMVHIVLANNTMATDEINVAKFADTAVDALILKMINQGAIRGTMVAKMAGGAHMFAQAETQNSLLRVGEKNVEVTKERLKKLRVPLVAEDVLGNCGRTIEFFPDTGILKVKTVGKGETTI